ncbi:MAG TPA: hypothetical protein VNI02_09435 [Blastocatellia bacterium]|jgi:cell division septation protein DedD|nr:hypothetical protein [Blastocatellia bacterium]
MSEGTDKREHSTKPEVDDLTDYQSLNSMGRAGVRGEAKETTAANSAEDSPAHVDAEKAAPASSSNKPATGIEYSGDYNDGADFTIVDNKGRTNA